MHKSKTIRTFKRTPGTTVKYILNEPAKREKSTTKKGSGKSGETPSLEDTMFDAKVSWLGMN